MKIESNADKTITHIYPFNLNKMEGVSVIQDVTFDVYQPSFVKVHSAESLTGDEAAQFAAALCVARTVCEERNKRIGQAVPKIEQELEHSGG